MSYKPNGYTSVAPYLVVADAERTLAFAAEVFGGETLRVFRDGDDRIVHAESRIDDTVVMIGQMPGGPAAHVHVYVTDVDATYERALAAGAVAVEAPASKPEGDRRGGVRDPNGTTWWLGRQERP